MLTSHNKCDNPQKVGILYMQRQLEACRTANMKDTRMYQGAYVPHIFAFSESCLDGLSLLSMVTVFRTMSHLASRAGVPWCSYCAHTMSHYPGFCCVISWFSLEDCQHAVELLLELARPVEDCFSGTGD